jgi:Ca2+/Na+ antiporter
METQTKVQNNNKSEWPFRLTWIVFIIAGLYMFYQYQFAWVGSSEILFYVWLILFAALLIFSFLRAERRIKANTDIKQKIAAENQVENIRNETETVPYKPSKAVKMATRQFIMLGIISLVITVLIILFVFAFNNYSGLANIG